MNGVLFPANSVEKLEFDYEHFMESLGLPQW